MRGLSFTSCPSVASVIHWHQFQLHPNLLVGLLWLPALVAIDLVAYGEIWDLPLAWGIFLFTEFVFGYFAISFFLAAAFAVPG